MNAYRDPFGRETVTWVRTFAASRIRRFDAYMVYSAQRGCIVTTWERINTWRSISN
jgi:hypothetical protein